MHVLQLVLQGLLHVHLDLSLNMSLSLCYTVLRLHRRLRLDTFLHRTFGINLLIVNWQHVCELMDKGELVLQLLELGALFQMANRLLRLFIVQHLVLAVLAGR